MPYNRAIVQRRRRGAAPYAAALARGVATAYRNRHLITKVTRKVKDTLTRPRKKARYAPKKSYGINDNAPGNDWSVARKAVIGRKKRNTLSTLKKMVEVGMSTTVYRFQGITNFDTNVGFFKLPNWQYSAFPQVDIPFHVYELNCLPNNGSPNVAHQYQWSSVNTTADALRSPLQGQDAGGVTGVTTWQTEIGKTAILSPNQRMFRHNWTSIKLNLYGPRKRTTRFDVIFLRIKDENANLTAAAITSSNYKELVSYLERPCIYSNLQTANPSAAKKIQIVKRMSYWVAASQTTDVDTTVGKIKEANIFMRHDRNYSLDWRTDTGQEIGHSGVDGIDFVDDVSHHNHPWYSSRLYMVIRAFAPQRVTKTTGGYENAADPNVDPTYDIVIRNSVSQPY